MNEKILILIPSPILQLIPHSHNVQSFDPLRYAFSRMYCMTFVHWRFEVGGLGPSTWGLKNAFCHNRASLPFKNASFKKSKRSLPIYLVLIPIFRIQICDTCGTDRTNDVLTAPPSTNKTNHKEEHTAHIIQGNTQTTQTKASSSSSSWFTPTKHHGASATAVP